MIKTRHVLLYVAFLLHLHVLVCFKIPSSWIDKELVKVLTGSCLWSMIDKFNQTICELNSVIGQISKWLSFVITNCHSCLVALSSRTTYVQLTIQQDTKQSIIIKESTFFSCWKFIINNNFLSLRIQPASQTESFFAILSKSCTTFAPSSHEFHISLSLCLGNIVSDHCSSGNSHQMNKQSHKTSLPHSKQTVNAHQGKKLVLNATVNSTFIIHISWKNFNLSALYTKEIFLVVSEFHKRASTVYRCIHKRAYVMYITLNTRPVLLTT